jgi:hypothetical protein
MPIVGRWFLEAMPVVDPVITSLPEQLSKFPWEKGAHSRDLIPEDCFD